MRCREESEAGSMIHRGALSGRVTGLVPSVTSQERRLSFNSLKLIQGGTQATPRVKTARIPWKSLALARPHPLAEKRRRKRDQLLAATEVNLTKLARGVSRRTKAPLSAAEIGVKAGRVVGRHKMAKHIRLTISDGAFTWCRDDNSIQKESLLDGIYVVRTSEPAERLSAEASVRSYKRLSLVEQWFRCLKGIDLLVRRSIIGLNHECAPMY